MSMRGQDHRKDDNWRGCHSACTIASQSTSTLLEVSWSWWISMVLCRGSPGRLPLCRRQCCQLAALLLLLFLLFLRLLLLLLLISHYTPNEIRMQNYDNPILCNNPQARGPQLWAASRQAAGRPLFEHNNIENCKQARMRQQFTSLNLTFSQVVWLFRLLVNTSHTENIHELWNKMIGIISLSLEKNWRQQMSMRQQKLINSSPKKAHKDIFRDKNKQPRAGL